MPETDITKLSDDELDTRIAALDEKRRAARAQMVALAAERDRRANAKELAELAARLGPEKIAELAKLQQKIEASSVVAAAAAHDPG